MPGLPPRAAKQMRSSRGFRRTDPGGGARWARSETQPAFAAAPVETLDSARSQHEACAICLEALDDCSFNHPCGQGHRLHYDCTLHFLSSALSLPLSDESPGPLLRQEARELGRGFQAVAVLFEAMSRMPSETRLRLCCPLCRCDWPQEKQRLTDLAGQLRQSRIKQVASRLGKLEEAYRQVQLRYEQRLAVQSHLLGSALGILEKNLHVASTFFSYSGPAVTCILEFLEAPAVTHLSLCSAATRQHCWEGARLCAPHIKIPVVRWARRLSAQRARSLLVDPSLAIGKLTSGLDVLSFGSWLQAAEQLQEISMVAADWERLDPGASCLARTLPRNLQILDLSQNGLTDESVMNLALKLGGRLQTLTLELNHITAKGFGALLTLAKDAAGCIRSWGFRHNQLGDESCRLLATRLDPEALGARGRLECWDLRTNGIGVEGCKWLAPLVGHMVVARLGCNPLGDKGGELLANGLGQKLQVLDLRQAQLGEAATLALGRRLREAQSLQELLLSGNQIGASGAHALAEGWAWISTLRYVDLAGNPIGAEGVDLLSDEMPFWQQAPFRLSLASTGCEEQSARKMAAVLHKNPRRNRGWTIELQNNSLSSGILVEIARLLEESLPGFTPRFR